MFAIAQAESPRFVNVAAGGSRTL